MMAKWYSSVGALMLTNTTKRAEGLAKAARGSRERSEFGFLRPKNLRPITENTLCDSSRGQMFKGDAKDTELVGSGAQVLSSFSG